MLMLFRNLREGMEGSLLTGPDPLGFKTAPPFPTYRVREMGTFHTGLSLAPCWLSLYTFILGHSSALIQMGDRSTSHSDPS